MYLGWDIGIKNMSYCNIVCATEDDKDDENCILFGDKYYKIKDWDVINLLQNIETPSRKVKNKKDIKSNEEIKQAKKIKATQNDLTLLGSSLYKELDKLPQLLNVNTVLLENQPVLKNPTMKSMQMFLYSYFILRGIIDVKNIDEDSVIDNNSNNDNKQNIEKIKCYAARNKLNLLKLVSEEVQEEIDLQTKKLKTKYSRNKKIAILLTESIISKNYKFRSFYKTHKKKDDLADSFLMTLYYIIDTHNKLNKTKQVKKVNNKKKAEDNKKEDCKIEDVVEDNKAEDDKADKNVKPLRKSKSKVLNLDISNNTSNQKSKVKLVKTNIDDIMKEINKKEINEKEINEKEETNNEINLVNNESKKVLKVNKKERKRKENKKIINEDLKIVNL